MVNEMSTILGSVTHCRKTPRSELYGDSNSHSTRGCETDSQKKSGQLQPGRGSPPALADTLPRRSPSPTRNPSATGQLPERGQRRSPTAEQPNSVRPSGWAAGIGSQMESRGKGGQAWTKWPQSKRSKDFGGLQRKVFESIGASKRKLEF